MQTLPTFRARYPASSWFLLEETNCLQGKNSKQFLWELTNLSPGLSLFTGFNLIADKLDGIRPLKGKRRREESPPFPLSDDDDPYDEREEDMRIGKKRVSS